MNTRSGEPGDEGEGRDVLTWGVGCAIGAAATVGLVILLFLVALALQPPVWVQIVVGTVVAVGAAIFTWLVTNAWRLGGRGRGGSERSGSR
jgi:uncharacterized BrkB/YihY/UPF0761 family membrane protein